MSTSEEKAIEAEPNTTPAAPSATETEETNPAVSAATEAVQESKETAPLPDPKPTEPASTSGPTWPDLEEDHPLSKLLSQLPSLTQEASHSEIYGIQLSPTTNPFQTKLILQKFLRANANDVEKAKAQLLATLQWRKEFQPLKAVEETFSRERFGGLGYVLTLKDVPESKREEEEEEEEVVTFNVYGAVGDNKKTFGDLEGFLRWRVALMELGVSKLHLSDAQTPIPDYGQGPDPYQGIQVHDYLSISFLRQDPDVKAASKKTIETLQAYYPETLSRKFFVNVPVVMGWLFAAMKLVVAKETVKKFTVLSYGNQLVRELGPGVPKTYGGQGEELDVEGETLKME